MRASALSLSQSLSLVAITVAARGATGGRPAAAAVRVATSGFEGGGRRGRVHDEGKRRPRVCMGGCGGEEAAAKRAAAKRAAKRAVRARR